jgi:acetyltransferase-like isoleucine patch superfamily enzyme
MSYISYIISRLIKKNRGNAILKSKIHKSSKIESGSTIVNSIFARHSFCGYDCTILNCDIGAFCSIASRVTVGGVSHPLEFVSTSPVFLSHKDSVKAKFASHVYLPLVKTSIANDVWIGEGAYVKAGVSVGNGAVIGMGAVVTKDVPPYAIVAGNPARLIRFRFNDEIIKGLQASQWWELPNDRLFELGPFMSDPVEFLKRV